MNKCKCGCGQDCKLTYVSGHNNKGRKVSEETKLKLSKSNKGVKRSQQTKDRISAALKGKLKENSRRWLGGNSEYYHKKAWDLFGKDKCEICGIKNIDHKNETNMRLGMHCRSNNYTLLEEENWVTVCLHGCHQKMEKLDGGKDKSKIKWRI